MNLLAAPFILIAKLMAYVRGFFSNGDTTKTCATRISCGGGRHRRGRGRRVVKWFCPECASTAWRSEGRKPECLKGYDK